MNVDISEIYFIVAEEMIKTHQNLLFIKNNFRMLQVLDAHFREWEPALVACNRLLYDSSMVRTWLHMSSRSSCMAARIL